MEINIIFHYFSKIEIIRDILKMMLVFNLVFQMVIVTEKKCLMVLVLISLSMVLCFLIFNVTTFIPSHMVLLQVESPLSNEIGILKQKGINKTPKENETAVKLKKEFSKSSAFQNMPSFNRNSTMVGNMSKVNSF